MTLNPLIECQEGVQIMVANVTQIVHGSDGDTGGFHRLPQPIAGYVIVGLLAMIRALSEEGHGEQILLMAQRIGLATQVAVTSHEEPF